MKRIIVIGLTALTVGTLGATAQATANPTNRPHPTTYVLVVR